MKIGHKLVLGFSIVALLVGVVGYLAVNASQKALRGYFLQGFRKFNYG